jgi:NlpC/P60 family putative phage cell wall peptidase
MARHFLTPSHTPRSGDVLLFRMRAGSVAKHLGILAETPAGHGLIHAYTGHGVVESALGPAWQKRIAARFAFPERAS